MLIDIDLMERYRAVLQVQMIDWDAFKFSAVAIDETKVNVIDPFSIFF